MQQGVVKPSLAFIQMPFTPSDCFGTVVKYRPAIMRTRRALSNSASVRIRIRKVPPSNQLEGFDLQPYAFRQGQIYTVNQQLASVLISWGYAERAIPSKCDRSAVKARRR